MRCRSVVLEREFKELLKVEELLMVTHGASDDDDGIGDAGETVIDCSVIRDSTVEMEVDVPLKWLIEARTWTWGGSLDLTLVLPVRTHYCVLWLLKHHWLHWRGRRRRGMSHWRRKW